MDSNISIRIKHRTTTSGDAQMLGQRLHPAVHMEAHAAHVPHEPAAKVKLARLRAFLEGKVPCVSGLDPRRDGPRNPRGPQFGTES
eukprot:8721196-Pyramimonas_sp.AAC.1